jgi:uncharacterized membrane protein YagU involved in acid resistance
MSSTSIKQRHSPAWLQVLLGGLAVALGDTIFAATWWFGWSVPGLVKLFQTIAVGVLGKVSFDGGAAAAWLGAGLQVFMATMFVVVYTLASQRVPALLRRPFVHGVLYGVVLYVVMNFVVMPLSRVGAHPTLQHPDWIVLSILAHMVFGVACVLFARRALQR